MKGKQQNNVLGYKMTPRRCLSSTNTHNQTLTKSLHSYREVLKCVCPSNHHLVQGCYFIAFIIHSNIKLNTNSPNAQHANVSLGL